MGWFRRWNCFETYGEISAPRYREQVVGSTPHYTSSTRLDSLEERVREEAPIPSRATPRHATPCHAMPRFEQPRGLSNSNYIVLYSRNCSPFREHFNSHTPPPLPARSVVFPCRLPIPTEPSLPPFLPSRQRPHRHSHTTSRKINVKAVTLCALRWLSTISTNLKTKLGSILDRL